MEHALCTVIRYCIVAIAVGLGGAKGRQCLIGPWDVSSRRLQSGRLVDVLHSLKHTLITDP